MAHESCKNICITYVLDIHYIYITMYYICHMLYCAYTFLSVLHVCMCCVSLWYSIHIIFHVLSHLYETHICKKSRDADSPIPCATACCTAVLFMMYILYIHICNTCMKILYFIRNVLVRDIHVMSSHVHHLYMCTYAIFWFIRNVFMCDVHFRSSRKSFISRAKY